MEKAVHHQLIKYLESEKLLSDQQYGYRKYRSTELASIHLTDDIRKYVDNFDGALFVDQSKAFDTLSHDVLIRKLKTYGIRGIASDWFTIFSIVSSIVKSTVLCHLEKVFCMEFLKVPFCDRYFFFCTSMTLDIV